MNEKLTVTNLKALLYCEVQDIHNFCTEIEDKIGKYNTLEEAYNYIKNAKSMEELDENNLILSLQLDFSLGKKADSYVQRLLKSIYILNLYKSQGKKNSTEYNNEYRKFNDFKDDLYQELVSLNKKIELLKSKYNVEKEIKYRRVLSRLKYKQFITGDQLETIAEFLEENNYEPKEIIKFCEKIRIYNEDLHKRYNKDYSKYDFLNLLRTNYEKFPVLMAKNKISSNLQNSINNILSALPSYKTIPEDVIVQFPSYDENIFDETEYKILYYEVMRGMQNQIKDIVDMASDTEFYFDKELKNDISTEYNEWIKLYIVTRSFFDNQIDNIRKDEIKKEDFNEEKTKIYFSKNDNNISYLERDLKLIPEEYYSKIIKLLESKKYGLTNTLNDKQLLNSNALKQCRELKDDQIRIVYRNIGNNGIIILGAGVKKSDNDITMYKTLAARSTKIENIELTDEEIYNRIIETCEENKRKGIR